MIKTQKTVDFADIFFYAEKKLNVNWNVCNDLFFGCEGIFTYQSQSEVWLSDCVEGMRDWKDDCPEKYQAYEIMHKFMLDNKLKKILVLCS